MMLNQVIKWADAVMDRSQQATAACLKSMIIFSRTVDKGEFSLFLVSGEQTASVSDYVGPNLQNGVATDSTATIKY